MLLEVTTAHVTNLYSNISAALQLYKSECFHPGPYLYKWNYCMLQLHAKWRFEACTYVYIIDVYLCTRFSSDLARISPKSTYMQRRLELPFKLLAIKCCVIQISLIFNSINPTKSNLLPQLMKYMYVLHTVHLCSSTCNKRVTLPRWCTCITA